MALSPDQMVTIGSQVTGGTSTPTGSALSGAAQGAAMGSVVPGVGTVVGGVVGLFSGILAGNKSRDEAARNAAAAVAGNENAAAINTQRDAIRANTVFQTYVKAGAFQKYIDADRYRPTLLDPPAVDAFGSAVGALGKINAALIDMKEITLAMPAYQKWKMATNMSIQADGYSPEMLIEGPSYGLGNVPQSMRCITQAWELILDAEQKEVAAINATPQRALPSDISSNIPKVILNPGTGVGPGMLIPNSVNADVGAATPPAPRQMDFIEQLFAAIAKLFGGTNS